MVAWRTVQVFHSDDRTVFVHQDVRAIDRDAAALSGRVGGLSRTLRAVMFDHDRRGDQVLKRGGIGVDVPILANMQGDDAVLTLEGDGGGDVCRRVRDAAAGCCCVVCGRSGMDCRELTPAEKYRYYCKNDDCA